MKTFVIGDVHGRREQLSTLLAALPRTPATDTLVLLGDLIDRGEDAPGVIAEALKVEAEAPERVVILRGNHEQMMLDFLDDKSDFWLTHMTGCERTFAQYTKIELPDEDDHEIETLSIEEARSLLAVSVPPAHLELLRRTPLYYEDEYAIYVHAGLDRDLKHPRDTAPEPLLWARAVQFFKNYHGKPCVFGHTPTPLLPLIGRVGHYGIYMYRSAIGLDTSGHQDSPLSCLSLPDFTLYQSFPGGRTSSRHLTAFLPEALRAMQKKLAEESVM